MALRLMTSNALVLMAIIHSPVSVVATLLTVLTLVASVSNAELILIVCVPAPLVAERYFDAIIIRFGAMIGFFPVVELP